MSMGEPSFHSSFPPPVTLNSVKGIKIQVNIPKVLGKDGDERQWG